MSKNYSFFPLRIFYSSTLYSTKFLFPHQRLILSPNPLNDNFDPIKNFYSCSHSSCVIFSLPLYFMYTQVMLILILIYLQYLQKVALSFEKILSGQNHSLSDCITQQKNFPRQIFLPHPLPFSTALESLEKGLSL